MGTLAIWLAVVGFAAAMIVGRRLLDFRPASLVVVNFRGRRIPAVGGLVLTLCVLLLSAVLGVVRVASAGLGRTFAFSAGPGLPFVLGMVLLAVGFFALGSVDDMSEGATAKGLSGHLLALRKGVVTGGLIKAGGGLALAFVVSIAWESRLLPAVADALLIALCANLFNLLDLRPGRACKMFFFAWIPLALLSAERAPVYLPFSAGFAGAVSGWLPFDLREKAILGDSGSNMLGAVVGAGIVLVAGVPAQILVLALLVALTIASERISFTRVIGRIRPLNWIDRLGRAPE